MFFARDYIKNIIGVYIAYNTSRHCGHVMCTSSPIITAACMVDILIDWPQAGTTSLK